MPYRPYTREEIQNLEQAVHDAFRPLPKDAAGAEPDFRTRKVLAAGFRKGRRTAAWHLSPEAAKQLAGRLSNAADRILVHGEMGGD